MSSPASQPVAAQAIMFHHFHDHKHPVVQGSISAEQFSSMIDWLQERYSIISATDYIQKFRQGSLRSHEICLTFDDALLCQAEVAAPMLQRRGIEAFFFVYSSPFSGMPDYLEVYRYFRTTRFHNIDEFYQQFFAATEALLDSAYQEARAAFASLDYLQAFPFYTANDRWFRYLRDEALGKERYAHVMSLLMQRHRFDPMAESKQLWMTEAHLRSLSAEGHLVGLHSFSHPTTMHKLSAEQQQLEYSRNYRHLSEVLNRRPVAMSHPSGNYNSETLALLSRMGVDIGFRSNLAIREVRSKLEIPRQDHANILAEMTT